MTIYRIMKGVEKTNNRREYINKKGIKVIGECWMIIIQSSKSIIIMIVTIKVRGIKQIVLIASQ